MRLHSGTCLHLFHSFSSHTSHIYLSISSPRMADRTNPSSHTQHRPIYNSTTVPRSNNTTTNHPLSSLLRQLLQSQSPNHSGQLFGFLAFFISGGILLLLTGITVTASVLGFIAFLPLIIITSPIWIPLFLVVTGFLSVAGSLFATGAVVLWLYRYFKGMHPLGSDQVDYARSRIHDTAAHVKDYAGGYFHGTLKDAAPGA
ncbi:oleosin 14.9 kDa [Arabidopsis lyrata subsp. lyrata]|nr:oleosin 14.9 kDa [Arabidopsis lyrata subsp. lyrata]|eukprot:XP_020866597.1 oleosin 14.9 kDa [Arabidopsis lyrata subsp. lyrata]